MNRIGTSLFLFFVLACKGPNETASQKARTGIEPLIEEWLAETGVPSLSYVFMKGDSIHAKGALGYANLKRKVLADTLTFYSTGSNFKSVTASAILQLHEKGLLNIEAPINNYLKHPIKTMDGSEPIKVKHLMSHQSGIPSSFRSRRLWTRNAKDLFFNEIGVLLEPNSPPEALYQYCNDCFALLGEIIENVSGRRYEDYVFDNILKPLGITSYGFSEPTAEMMEDMALPYHMRYNKPYPMDFVRSDQYPSGDLYLKSTDMARFLLMHLNKGEYKGKRLLSEKSVKMMHSPQIKVEEQFYYGLGFGIEEIDGKYYPYHQGSMPGYLSVFRMDTNSKMAVYLATNVTASALQEKQLNALLDKLFQYVMSGSIPGEIYFQRAEKSPENLQSSRRIDGYVGIYEIEGTPVKFIIEKIGNGLYLINPNGQRFRLEYLESNRFFLTTEDEDIEFIPGNNGSIESLVFYSGDEQIKAVKKQGTNMSME